MGQGFVPILLAVTTRWSRLLSKDSFQDTEDTAHLEQVAPYCLCPEEYPALPFTADKNTVVP